MLQHNRNQTPNMPRRLRPLCSWPKQERLRRGLLERSREQHHGFRVRVEHGLVLLASEVAHFQGPFNTGVVVVGSGGLQET